MNTKQKKVLILIIIYFFQGIVTNIHHPLMPYYINDLGLKEFMFGFLFSFMNLGIMLGGPFWGNLGDRGKKRIVLLTGLLIYGFGQLLFGAGHIFNQGFLIIFRFISGFGIAAAFTAISSEIIVLSNSENRSKNITFGVASLALGGSIGFFLGGFIHTNKFVISILKTDSFFNAMFLQFVLVITLALLSFVFFKQDIQEENEIVNKKVNFWEGFKEIKNINSELIFFLIALTFITIAATNVDKYIDVYFSDLGFKANVLGNFKMVSGLIAIATTVLLVPLMLKIKKQLLLISILQILSALIIFIVFRVKQDSLMTVLYSVFMIYIVFKAIFSPIEQDYIAKRSEPTKIATTIGIRQSFYSVGTIIGPIFGAFIYQYNKILLFDTSVIFFLLSIVFIVLSYLARKKNQLNQIETK